MKRANFLFERLCLEENLCRAFCRASRRKRLKKNYLLFRKNYERNIAALRAQLAGGTWECGEYSQFKISDPKERLITAADFSDRIVHHAIINVSEEIFERQFIFHTYACRKGKGTHAALRYAQKKCASCAYFLKMDVKKYFDSIDHVLLMGMLKKIFKDEKFLALLYKIIASYRSQKGDGKGLPIGNLTSQYFANLYLSSLDHFVLEKLSPKGFVRYMDDMIIFDHSTEKLKACWKKINSFALENLSLELKPPVFGKCGDGLPFLGKLIKKDKIRPLKEKMRLKRRKIKKIDYLVKTGKITQEKAQERITAILADAGGCSLT